MKALMLRAQYMAWSLQKFPRVAARCLHMLIDEDYLPALIDDEVLDEILRGSATDASQGQAPDTLAYPRFQQLQCVRKPRCWGLL